MAALPLLSRLLIAAASASASRSSAAPRIRRFSTAPCSRLAWIVGLDERTSNDEEAKEQDDENDEEEMVVVDYINGTA